MSGGRVELGLGAGWFDAEHAAYGIPFPDMGERFDRFAEQVEIIDGLLATPDGATYSFDGKHYQLADRRRCPSPCSRRVRRSSWAARARRRSAALAARYADEYNVSFKFAQTGEIFDRVRAAAAETGTLAGLLGGLHDLRRP